MSGRGIDQVLAHPCSPELYEHYVRSAEDYVLHAEQANGSIPRRNGPSYVWGVALDEFNRMHPDARIKGVGTSLLAAICAGFRRAGVRKVRTMLSRDNNLILSFFRSQGMMAGPFIPLEMDLER